MVVIRLVRTSCKHKPKYRMAVADSRRWLKGRFIEVIGHYDPLSKDKKATIDLDKYKSWVSKGAQASQTVKSLYKKIKS